MKSQACANPEIHGTGKVQAPTVVSRRLQLLSRIGLSLLAGLVLGAAWREFFPALTGLLGLGFFFWAQAQSRHLLPAAILALLTGLVGQLVACASWLVATASVLAGTGTVLSCVFAFLICLFHSMVFVVFASFFWCGKSLSAKLASNRKRGNRPRQARRRRLKRDESVPNDSIEKGLVQSVARSIESLNVWHLFFVPVAWGLAELVTPTFYPFSMGCLLVDHPALCQLAELGGVHLLSAFAVLIALVVPFACACVSSLLLKDEGTQPFATWVATAGVISVVVSVGLWSNHRFLQVKQLQAAAEKRRDGIKLLMVQAETETSVANKRMIRASRKVSDNADLVLWPEAALGNYNRELLDFSDTDKVASNSIGLNTRFRPFPDPGAFLLAGADTWLAGHTNKSPRQSFVSALLFDRSEQLVGRHDKVGLMPYGEYIPGEQWFPQIREWLGSSRIISRGSRLETIGQVKGQTLGVLLCCEDMDPDLFRTLAAKDADVLISLGNGMAFNTTLPLKQHFRISRLRAIENRRYFARCMSRGVSALLSPSGETVHRLPTMQDGAMLFEVPRLEPISTKFTRYGNTPLVFLLAIYSIVWIVLARRFV